MEIGDRSFDLLLALVERRDRVVTKDELLDLGWQHVVVEESQVQVQSAARASCSPATSTPLSMRGYRFTAPLLSAAAGHLPARAA